MKSLKMGLKPVLNTFNKFLQIQEIYTNAHGKNIYLELQDQETQLNFFRKKILKVFKS